MLKEKVKGKEAIRPIQKLFNGYAARHQGSSTVSWIYIPLFTFSILGLIWAIPVQFHFLGKYKDFANIATIVIGFSMYYYWTLSRTLFWAMLFTLGVFSYLIVQLEYWERAGGPVFWQVCAFIFILACIGLFVDKKIGGRKTTFQLNINRLLIAPLWLWSKLFNKLRIPY